MKISNIKRAMFSRLVLTPTFNLKLVNVIRRKDSAVVAQGVTLEAANELIAKAARQKRAALVLA